jgi:hypothetical protein
MSLKEFNELNIETLSVSDVQKLCEQHNICAFIQAGKLICFEPDNG